MENKKLTHEEKIWISWLLVTALTFSVLEGHAIYNKKHHATLTYTIRKQLGIHPVRPWKLVGTGFVVGFSSWFAVHIVTGKFVPRAMRTIQEVKEQLHDDV